MIHPVLRDWTKTALRVHIDRDGWMVAAVLVAELSARIGMLQWALRPWMGPAGTGGPLLPVSLLPAVGQLVAVVLLA